MFHVKHGIVACEANEILPTRQGHKRVDTYGFHPLVNHPFPLESTAKIGETRPLRKGETAIPFIFRRGEPMCPPIS